MKYSMVYECDECPEIYTIPSAAAKCCGTGDYSEVFRCDNCKSIHADATLAAECGPHVPVKVPSKIRSPKTEPPVQSLPLAARTTGRIVRPPQPDCEYCGMAQRFGKVVSCICMKG